MVMKTYAKSILRSIKNNIAKFVSIVVIMLLGIAFVSGLGTLSSTVEHSISNSLNDSNFSDIIIKCKSPTGFTDNQIAKVKALEYVEQAEMLTVADIDQFGQSIRIYGYDSFDTKINKLSIEGSLPSAPNEIMVERKSNTVLEHKIGDKIPYDILAGKSLVVVGIVSNPTIFDRFGELNMVSQKEITQIFYLNKQISSELIANMGGALGMTKLPTTDINVRISGLTNRRFFSNSYLEQVNSYKEKLNADINEDYVYLTIEQNKGFVVMQAYSKKVNVITLIFPVFFIAVAALVVMTTMTRMVEEERPMIGCLKSLGASDSKIISKYAILAAVCCLLAVGLGLAVGLTLLLRVIYPAYNTLFFMPTMSGYVNPLPGVLSFVAMLIVTLAVTVAVCKGTLKQRPSELLLPKAPKLGKTILLERWTWGWSKLPFRYKSTFRNIFRYKKHLAMTIISVVGSTALVFAGLALHSVSGAISKGNSFGGISESLGSIAAVIVVFALVLCMFVIYNLTNLNIGERKKEIATLGVLGYKSTEILGYVYREILIVAAIAAIFGELLGMALIHFVLTYVEFGSLADVQWYTYISAYALIIAFVMLTDLILIPKIIKVDMTGSLKAND